jgi:RNA polymerase sigma factor (sigma-70 family)
MTRAKPSVTGSLKVPTTTAFKEYAVVLSRYLLRRVKRREDAEDLAQEVFELFLRRRDHQETVRDPLSYLFRIAFHVLGESLRREHRCPVTFDSSLVEDPADFRSEGATIEEDFALKDEIAKALGKLPHNHVTALMLVEGQGMSYKEAATTMGLSTNSVAVYVSRARAALKLALDEEYRPRGPRP